MVTKPHESPRTARYDPRLNDYFGGKSILVTGGMGFLGSHLVATLVELGGRVTVLDLDTDRLRPSIVNDVPGLREHVTLVQGDVADLEVVRTLFRTPFSSVFNLASFASVIERAVDHPYQTIRTSTLGLVNIMECTRTSPKPPLSVVHTSTDKVYGQSNGQAYDEELTPLKAEGVYDVAKLAADALAQMYCRAYACPAVVVRLCNVFGPADHNSDYRVVPRAMKAIFGDAQPRPPSLYAGSLSHERDYIYVDDCIRALLVVATTERCRGRIYNLMGCAHLRTPQMIEALIDAASDVEGMFDLERASAIRRNAYEVVGETAQSAITIRSQHSTGERLRRDTGFVPAMSLGDGLVRTALSYRAHFAAAPQATAEIEAHE